MRGSARLRLSNESPLPFREAGKFALQINIIISYSEYRIKRKYTVFGGVDVRLTVVLFFKNYGEAFQSGFN